jgi:putative dimethyl sulfoxide reductase chaperone
MTDLDPDQAAAREDLCRFLSACYYEPAAEFAEERLFDSILAAAQRLDPALSEPARRLGEAFAAQDLQTLLVDYTRLFLGPVNPRAKPYGSSWLSSESTLMQDSTLAVLDLYREGGFDIDEAFRDLPDHVAVELEFLYVLNFRQNQARLLGDGAAQAEAESLQQRLLETHLGRWIVPFTAAVKSGAETAFYRELADLTASVVLGFGRGAIVH